MNIAMTSFGQICVTITCYLIAASAQTFNHDGNRCPLFVCPLRCQSGYAVDVSGCQECRCAGTTGGSSVNSMGVGQPNHPGGGGVHMSMGGAMHNWPSTSSTYHKPCVKGIACGFRCSHGYYNGPDGCQFCICALPQTTQTTYNNPCHGDAQTCDLICKDGYQTESTGCQRCICAHAPISGVTTKQPPVSTTLSQEECQQKITECQLRYPYGFMTDDSCTLCIDKDDIYPAIITEEHQPRIRLSNPCIQGFDMCRIFCVTGYRTGPRSCQYCACKG